MCTDEPGARAAEDTEATAVDAEHAKEADAEQRRNAYLASGTDEGGRSYRASSDATKWSPMLSDDPRVKDARRTAALDVPVQKDELGNAILGIAAGGLVGGVRAVAAKALTGAGEIAAEVAMRIGTKAAMKAVTSVATETARSGVNAPLYVPPLPAATSARVAPTLAPVGRSGASGTSEVVPDADDAGNACVSVPFVVRG